MKYSITLAWCLLIVMPLLASNDIGKLQNTRTFPASELSSVQRLKVDIKDTNGGIILIQYEGETVKAETYGSSMQWNGGLSQREIAERLKRYEVTLQPDKKDFLIKVDQVSGGYTEGLKVTLKVYVPRAFHSDISTTGGDVEFRNYAGGKHEIRTSGGQIELNNFSGDLKADTNGGEANVLMASGRLEINTSGGNAWLAGLKGALDLKTGGGNVNADVNRAQDFVTINTGGGSIQVELPLRDGLDLNVEAAEIFMPDGGSDTSVRNRFQKKYGGGGVPVTIITTEEGIVRLLDGSSD